MGINLRELQNFTITDLSGGVNEFASTYKVQDRELITAKNMSFKDSGGIKVRMGDEVLDVSNVSGVSSGIKNMYRYVTSVGGRKTIMYSSDGYIWIDNDGVNQFVRVPSSTAQAINSHDGHCRFDQYLDTVIFGTDRDGMYLYNPNVSTIEFGRLSARSVWGGTSNFGVTVITSGGSLYAGASPPTYYEYRYTFDYQYSDFMGESGPLYVNSFGTVLYGTETAVLSTGSTNKVQLTKYVVNTLPDNVARINFYRSNPHPSIKQVAGLDRAEYFYIGSIEASVFEDASSGDVLFEDTGSSPGPVLEYSKMETPPRGRFINMHKGRIWTANVEYAHGAVESWANYYAGDEDYDSYPHRVFISSLNSNGNFEPGVFYTDQFREIDPRGSGITGMHSFQNEIQVIFKANSMWSIIGDDPHPITGNLRVNNISNSVGCVAPESICEIEGRLVWMSNSGMYYWDGGSKPAQLKTDNIVKTFQAIPINNKKNVASVYDKKQRELLVALSDSTTDGYNRKVAKFDLRTSAWSIDEYYIGIGAFESIDQPNEETMVYGGLSDTSGTRGLYGSAVELNSGTATLYNNFNGIWSGTDISFEFQTKFYDGGAPFMDKNFKAVAIDLKSPEELTLHVLCDSRLDTRNSSQAHPITGQEGFTITLPSQGALTWAGVAGDSEPVGRRWYNDGTDNSPTQILNTNKWAAVKQGTTVVYLDDRCWGKRISLIISGAVQAPVNIDSITVFYKPLATVREN